MWNYLDMPFSICKNGIMKNNTNLLDGITCAIFDLDGTLLDSLGIWAEIDEIFLGARGISVPDDYEDCIGHIGARAAAEYTIARFSLDESVDKILTEWKSLADEIYPKKVGLKPHAAQLLRFLRDRGIRLTIATAGNPDLFLPVLRREEVDTLFEGYTTISEVGRGKEFPDIFLLAASKLGSRPAECCVFEDNYIALCAARDGGFRTIAVYDVLRGSQQAKIAGVADIVIGDFSDLLPG